ncbi:hypothetical protein SBA6_470006 [Candidatus Sulfopaludibacter sp. SbA6]|nr:hypothetical protein SBA6_470006 [Candidatus Sulfopaludibacter sp. SbA6]
MLTALPNRSMLGLGSPFSPFINGKPLRELQPLRSIFGKFF